MPKVNHVREEIWDQATKDFKLKSLPTTPDVELAILRDDVALDPSSVAVLGSIEIPSGSVLRVTLLRYLTSDSRGAIFPVTQNNGTIDNLYLSSPGEVLVTGDIEKGEVLVTGDIEKPIYVLEGTVNLNLKAAFGSIYAGTIYGLTIHGYYSKQESLRYVT